MSVRNTSIESMSVDDLCSSLCSLSLSAASSSNSGFTSISGSGIGSSSGDGSSGSDSSSSSSSSSRSSSSKLNNTSKLSKQPYKHDRVSVSISSLLRQKAMSGSVRLYQPRPQLPYTQDPENCNDENDKTNPALEEELEKTNHSSVNALEDDSMKNSKQGKKKKKKKKTKVTGYPKKITRAHTERPLMKLTATLGQTFGLDEFVSTFLDFRHFFYIPLSNTL